MAKTEFVVDRENLQVRMTRTFNVSRERLFDVFTNPTLIPQWWGPANYTTTVERDEVEVGGKWRYVQKDPEGNEFAFNGEYKEVVPPERVTRTFEFEPMPGHIIEETAIFEALSDGTSQIIATAAYATIEDLDGMVSSGMEKGAVESYERLAELAEATKTSSSKGYDMSKLVVTEFISLDGVIILTYRLAGK